MKRIPPSSFLSFVMTYDSLLSISKRVCLINLYEIN